MWEEYGGKIIMKPQIGSLLKARNIKNEDDVILMRLKCIEGLGYCVCDVDNDKVLTSGYEDVECFNIGEVVFGRGIREYKIIDILNE